MFRPRSSPVLSGPFQAQAAPQLDNARAWETYNENLMMLGVGGAEERLPKWSIQLNGFTRSNLHNNPEGEHGRHWPWWYSS